MDEEMIQRANEIIEEAIRRDPKAFTYWLCAYGSSGSYIEANK
jgi:streptomycin 6-kinase